MSRKFANKNSPLEGARARFEIEKVKSRLLKRLIWNICIQYQKWRQVNFYKVKLFEIFTFE